MEEEILIPEFTKKSLFCPECGIETIHVWEGYRGIYSSWRCTICGKSILGPPYRKLPERV